MSSSSTDVYDAMAPIYDALGGSVPFAMLVAERLERLFELRRPQLLAPQAGAAPSAGAPVTSSASFLDLGCGTGTLLLALREAHPHWRLAGLDASPAMLAVAQTKPRHDTILWTRGVLPAPLPFAERFDLVGSFYDTLNHLPDHDALQAAFHAVAAVLRPGGMFIFDLSNAFGFERWWQYRIAFDVEGHHVDTQLRYDRPTRTARAAIALRRAGVERRLVLTQRCFSDAEVEGALVLAGLTTEIAAPWSPAHKDSPSKTWFVATKKQ